MCQLPVGMNWLWGKLGLALVGGAMLSKSLIQSPAEELGYAPSQLVVWPEQSSPGVGLLVTSKRTWANTCIPGLRLPVPLALQQATSNPCLWSRPSTLTGRSGSVPCGVTAPFPWVLVGTRFCFCLQRASVSPSPVEVLSSNPVVLQSQIPWGFSVPLRGSSSEPQITTNDLTIFSIFPRTV